QHGAPPPSGRSFSTVFDGLLLSTVCAPRSVSSVQSTVDGRSADPSRPSDLARTSEYIGCSFGSVRTISLKRSARSACSFSWVRVNSSCCSATNRFPSSASSPFARMSKRSLFIQSGPSTTWYVCRRYANWTRFRSVTLVAVNRPPGLVSIRTGPGPDLFGLMAATSNCGRFWFDGDCTCALALLDEARAHPPDERMEPEDRFDDCLNRCGQIVAPPDVRDFVREDRGALIVGQMRADGRRPQQYWTHDAEDARLEGRSRHD